MSRKFREHTGLDLPKTADEILAFWKENAIFEKSISSREGKKPFVFFEGPPSANGLPGIHHVMARAIKDIFCRYKTQKGFQVKRKAGWDTHGLPVELGVEKELGITKEDIGDKISVEEYNAACKKAVMRYTDVWNELTEKIGYWVDMDDPYITYKSKYMESVWWLLSQIYKQGLIYKGYTIQPYSPKAGTGLSSHELNQPGTYQDVADTTVTAMFKIKGPSQPSQREEAGSPPWGELEGAYFLAWTTTPWTLPSNTALTVGPKIEYVLVKTFNQYTFEPINVIVAKNLVDNQFGKKFLKTENEAALKAYVQGDLPAGEAGKIPYFVGKSFLGKELVGIKYEQLLPYAKPFQNPENAFRIIAGDFVTTEDGTGIVHTAPTFGADDAQVAKQAKPEVPPMLVKDENGNLVPLVDLQGKFRPEMAEFAGKYVKNEYYDDDKIPEKSVDVEIAIKLKEQNRAFNVEKYTHSYPNCWRTDKPILYYPMDSWFIKITAVKERMYVLNQKINWKPKSTGEGRFGNWLANANDWNLSRSRFWGTPLPIWRSEDGKEEILIASIEELKNEMDKSVKAGLMEKNLFADFEVGNMAEENYDQVDLHKNVVDQIVLVSPSGKPMKREADLIDVWFDSGSMPYAQWHYPYEEEAPFNSPKGGKTIPGYQTARNSSYHLLKEKARERKNHPTQAEKILWEALKGKKLSGYKFRREHIIDEYIADFVCLSEGLIVEVDGGYHTDPMIRENDMFRSEFLKENFGFNVIRFTNEEVIGAIDSVLNKIEIALIKRSFRKLSRRPPFGGDRGGFVADFIAEGVDQTRGWFYTLHAIATMIFDDVAYKNVVSNGLVLDKNGRKMSKRLGNAVDPFETISVYGPDATRWYMIANANPWDNLKFDIEGIAEVRRKFFGTLYNTYSFFALYANLDDFIYSEESIPHKNRPEIDRWILSELHTLIGNVDKFYEEYEPTKAVRAISEFVQENLSNWYVRLSRRRFWKPARQGHSGGDSYETDKISAYQTLYDCLETVAKLAAPVAPFYMDRLYKDLTQTTQKEDFESVHLSNFPKQNKDFIDEVLEQKMQKAQTITSLALSLRKKEKIKVRQPLQRIMIPVSDEREREEIRAVSDLIKSEVNVKEIELIDDSSEVLVKRAKPNFKLLGPRFGKDMKLVATAVNELNSNDISLLEKEGKIEVELNGKMTILRLEELEVQSQDIDGWLVAKNGNFTVALDISINEELKNEGIARELINRIQNLRKDSGFEVTDRIKICIQKDGVVENAVDENFTHIKNETLASDLELVDKIDEGITVDFDAVNTHLSIQKTGK